MNWRRLATAAATFLASIILVYGCLWTFLEVSSWFKVDFPGLRGLGAVGHYLFFLHAVLIAFVVDAIRRRLGKGHNSGDEVEPAVVMSNSDPSNSEGAAREASEIDILRRDLIAAVESAHQAGRYEEVIRFGSALQRPLFVSGNHSARLKIGTLVEDAAAVTSQAGVQVEMLVDAIGWSHVELGNLDAGEESIRHGLTLALSLVDDYWASRAFRHLGAIERRTKGSPDFGKAEEYFNKALDHAQRLPVGSQRSAAIAGSMYALASLHFHQHRYNDALGDLEQAAAEFASSGDETGVTRCMTKRADTLMQLERYLEARDLYRKALARAKRNSHRNQVVRSSIGLAKYHLAEKEWKDAALHLARAKGLAKEMNVRSELKEIANLEILLPAGRLVDLPAPEA